MNPVGLRCQVVYSFNEEGGIAKMIANKLMVNSRGTLLLPFWREMGGQPECDRQSQLHGIPGLLMSNDGVRGSTLIGIGGRMCWGGS